MTVEGSVSGGWGVGDQRGGERRGEGRGGQKKEGCLHFIVPHRPDMLVKDYTI